MFATVAEDLRRIVQSAADRYAAMPEAEVARKPAPEKWSKKEILGHLIDSAGNNHQRFVRAQLQGELTFPGYEQEGWARCQHYAIADWQHLVILWRAFNLHIANVIAAIPGEKETVSCTIGDDPPVTLHWLAEDYVGHMIYHLKQLDGPGYQWNVAYAYNPAK
jgi:hypothetical protein